ncbi:MBL fold metallo-hydrolase [Lachnospira multipara]|uniref:MBL fold metallo-hydrolase n=1 Tax=Lachnospira multipara TaxID=28051 RepID=UPI0004E25205|nr:MBL fold metallo-hydrolase [Lachnospira multipara]
MIVEVPVKGYFNENCYFYIDDETKHGFLIDPGAEAKRLLKLISDKGWNIEKILLTHGHFDHTGAVNEIRAALGIPVIAHKRADQYLLDGYMNLSAECGSSIIIGGVKYADDGDILSLEANPNFKLKVIYTPGHTTDSIIFYSERDLVAFVGDTIFKGCIGNYKYPGGNFKNLQDSIIDKIFTLPDETMLLSGHSDKTSVGIEKQRYGL